MPNFSCRVVLDLDMPGLPAGRLTVLALYGDPGVGTALESALAGRRETELVVDLGGLDRLSPDAAEILHRFAAAGAARDRRLRLAGCSADTAAVLARARPAGSAGPELHPTVPAALAAAVIRAARSGTGAAPGAALRPSALRLRHRLLGQAGVARAQGILVERYGLGDLRTADTLLRGVARTHRLPRAVLAASLAGTPAPAPSGPGAPEYAATSRPSSASSVRPVTGRRPGPPSWTRCGTPSARSRARGWPTSSSWTVPTTRCG